MKIRNIFLTIIFMSLPKLLVSNTWKEIDINSTHQLRRIVSIDSNTCYAIPQYYQEVFKTTDGGENWFSVMYKQNYHRELYSIFAPKPDLILISCDKGIIIRTENQFETYEEIFVGKEVRLENFDMFDENYGICGSNIELFKTTDGGKTWEELSMPEECDCFQEVVMAGKEKIFMHGLNLQNQLFYYSLSENGGKDWATVERYNPATLELYPSNTVFIDESTGVYVGKKMEGNQGLAGKSVIFKTIDGGMSWEPKLDSSLEYLSGLSRVRYYDENTLYACGANSYIYNSTDGGENWTVTLTPDIPDGYFTDFAYLTRDKLVFTCSNGKFYKYEKGSNSIEEIFAPQRENISIFPNPVASQEAINIKINMENVNKVSIRLFSMDGREIEPASEIKINGANTISYNPGSKLQSGMYLLEITINGEKYLKSVVVY